MNKYTFRRGIASIITIPVGIAAYFVLWALLIGLGAEGTFSQFQYNLPLISVMWVIGWTFGPDLFRYFEQRDAEREARGNH
jgi:hypothetical protein